MLKNYLTIALRNIKKHRGYSLINIAGLAVGMTCCILILLWVQDELSYDRFPENADRVFRLTYAEQIGDAFDHYALSPFAAAPAFAAEVPGIRTLSRRHFPTASRDKSRPSSRPFSKENRTAPRSPSIISMPIMIFSRPMRSNFSGEGISPGI
jgi:hypothetical protein